MISLSSGSPNNLSNGSTNKCLEFSLPVTRELHDRVGGTDTLTGYVTKGYYIFIHIAEYTAFWDNCSKTECVKS